MRKIIQKQKWKDYTRYIILNKYRSIIIDLFKKPVQWWNSSTQVGTVWIWSLYILPKYRRLGYAKGLLREAEHIALSNGHEGIYMVYTHSTPKWVLDFYICKRYKIVEEDKDGFMLYKSIK